MKLAKLWKAAGCGLSISTLHPGYVFTIQLRLQSMQLAIHANCLLRFRLLTIHINLHPPKYVLFETLR